MIPFLHKIYWRNISQIFVFLLFFSQSSIGQVKFTASANETTIGRNDVVEVRFKIENAQSVAGINPPSFQNFTVVSGPNHESSTSYINGQSSSYVVLSYILKPHKPGKFSIAPATAVANGQDFKSNRLTITVLDQPTVASAQKKPKSSSPFSGFGKADEPSSRAINEDYTLKPGENAKEKIRKNLFVKLEANKTNCYVGEPVVVSFKLYTRLLSKTNIIDAPSFNGFSVSEMDVNENATEVKSDGKVFNCYTLRKVQLFPMREGTFTISPLKSNNRVSFIKFEKGERQNADPFMQLLQDIGAQSFSSGQSVEEELALNSNSLTIHVKPLPEENKPDDFRGAVGNFSLQCSLDNEELTTDDAGNLLLTISGSGNMPLVNAPEIKWPKGLDVYDARMKEQLDYQQVPVSGHKVFNIPFTISKAGNYSLAPIHFSWFNPVSGKYESTKTEPINFKVLQGKMIHTARKIAQSPKGFLSVYGAEILGGLLLIGGLIVLLIYVFFRKKHKETELESLVKLDDLKNRQEVEETVIPGNPLMTAHEKLKADNADAFYRELDTCLKKYLSSKLKIPIHELSNESIHDKMDQCNVGIGTSRLFDTLVREIQLGLYAKNSHQGQMMYLYEKASELVALLDKQICNPS